MFSTHFYLTVFGIFTNILQTKTEECTGSWFGPNCDKLCHCVSGCTKQGDCIDDTQGCTLYEFGPGCQYVDRFRWVTYIDPVAAIYRDSNPNTCNTQADATNITVTFDVAVKFSWARIVVNNPAVLLNFTTSFNTNQKCWNEKKYTINSLTVDVTCDIFINMKSMTITGDIVPYVCDIHSSGGINVALRQKTWQTSCYEINKTLCGSQNCVDNGFSPYYSSGSCCKTMIESRGSQWGVKLERKTVLHKINIVNGHPLSNLIGHILSLYDEDGNREAYYTSNISSARYEYYMTTVKPIKSITLKQSTSVPLSERTMTFCEIMICGDPICPDNMYGILCDRVCTCEPSEACNFVTGVCSPGCVIPKTYGFNCSQNCSIHCDSDVCNYFSGSCAPCHYGWFGERCDEECLPGTYGLKSPCQKCSIGCANTCNTTTGACTCTDKYKGLNCNECLTGTFGGPENLCRNCSKGCADTCNAITGNCNCKTRYIGSQCTKCKQGTFGPDCEFVCSKGCANICNNSNGHCSCKPNILGVFCTECAVGFYGDDCTSKCAIGCSNVCNNSNGACECKPTFYGNRCSECVKGMFGVMCTKQCGEGCLGQCDKISGKCKCRRNYVSPFCTVCEKGVFGSSCGSKCGSGCAADCDKTNGSCACKKKFKGEQCTECVYPRYGRRCDLHCSKRCFNQSCYQMTGQCISCTAGNKGIDCTQVSQSYPGWSYPIPFMMLLVFLFVVVFLRREDAEEFHSEH